jgi:FMN-dependent NADH-azoreductase
VASLLHLDASANPIEHSVTRRLTAHYARTWRAHQDPATPHEHRHHDLVRDPVTPIGPAYCALGQRLERHGTRPPARVPELIRDPAEQHEWDLTRPLITALLAADTLLLGVPTYNLGLPAALKTWIDRISFPGAYTDPDTGESLLRHTRVVAIIARGGHGPRTSARATDHVRPYLRAYLTKLGFADTNLHIVHAELTSIAELPASAGDHELAARSLRDAHTTITALATHRETQPQSTARSTVASSNTTNTQNGCPAGSA